MARQERAIRTRQKILVAAAEVFDEVGYEATTISEILKRSEVTKGAFYFHFTSKEEIAQLILAEQVTAIPPIRPQDLALQEAVDEALLLAYLLRSGDARVRGSVRLTVEQGSFQDGLDRRVPMQGWISRSAELFEKAKANGELVPHVDVELIAKLFVGCFTGVQILSNIMTRHEDMLERVSELYRHLMATIAVPGVLIRLEFTPERAQRVYEAAAAHGRSGSREVDELV
ncbi:ScbR family autoregulator-binding transcription factor [Streptomyces resistomycificus]|uniref:Gamma-butyrolactone receptor protein n=1 Tax=Streptomyces resistomycificus TaxID=67356 RepID=A0A0L8LP71_9ACTN|nr:ScbR family autoregulator-binding transcription factor [Streptomyces resistomycificus]KOG39941.1 gamma-butyrolactone receptor protein [Streptomyces resistomycificus]KUN90609.1 gamma-butyrolactone receptor protein [Streptomyces resistomycificus]